MSELEQSSPMESQSSSEPIVLSNVEAVAANSAGMLPNKYLSPDGFLKTSSIEPVQKPSQEAQKIVVNFERSPSSKLEKSIGKMIIPASALRAPSRSQEEPAEVHRVPELKKDVEKESNPGISYDDEKLVDMFLYPENGPMMLYSKLVGDVKREERHPWNPEQQKWAARGMRELFDAEFNPVSIKGEGVEGAREGLSRLSLPENQHLKDSLANAGRRLKYQSTRNYEDLKKGGDFLHFGIDAKYAAEDKLPAIVRVYATPKPWAIGHVAAKVIIDAREKGYEPYGKVWDESTSGNDLSERQDRLLFYTRTESQLRIITESLRDLQASDPNLFEAHPPLLAEKTDIPGVGLAEEPPKVNGQNQSYNESRLQILEEAWNVALDKVTAGQDKEKRASLGIHIVQERLVKLREAIEQGQYPKSKLINAYRDSVKEISLKHGVSPDNFALNAR